jgi:uncharacterized protein with HEPN domain
MSKQPNRDFQATLRDVLIHAYDRVDLQEVWLSFLQLPELRQKIALILRQLD